jgi:hypothetical protein
MTPQSNESGIGVPGTSSHFSELDPLRPLVPRRTGRAPDAAA